MKNRSKGRRSASRMKRHPHVFAIFITLLCLNLNVTDTHAQNVENDIRDALQSTKKAFKGLFGRKDAQPATVQPEGFLDGRSKRLVQQHLNTLGYDAGAPDGAFGPRTRKALRAFQSSIGVEPTGYMSPALFERLSGSAQNNADRRTVTVQPQAKESLAKTRSNDRGAVAQGEYGEIMRAWFSLHEDTLSEETLAAAYGYAFEGYESKDAYCKSLGSIVSQKGNSILASQELAELYARYQAFLARRGVTELPLDLRLQFAVTNPYDDYNLADGYLKLRNQKFGLRFDLADGRTGIEYSACRSFLQLPQRAQVNASKVVPEEFKFDLGEIIRAAHKTGDTRAQGDVAGERSAHELLRNIAMEKDAASALLSQPGREATLRVTADIRLARPSATARPNENESHGFAIVPLRIHSVDVITGHTVHDIAFEAQSSIPDYLRPLSAPANSGLPDGLTYLDDAIVVYPDQVITGLQSTPQTQFALRQLEQKLLLQAHPEFARTPEHAIRFADLAGAAADDYVVRIPLIEAAGFNPGFKWLDYAGGAQQIGDGDPLVAVSWRPTRDAFDENRLHQAFVENVSNTLLGEPVKLPFDVVHLQPVDIRAYSLQHGGFPLSTKGSGLSLRFPSVRLASDAGTLTQVDLSSHVKGLVPFNRFPDVWNVPIEVAETLQASLSFKRSGSFANYSEAQIAELLRKNPSMQSELTHSEVANALLATRMRITQMTYQPPRTPGMGHVTLDMALLGLTLYEGDTTERVIGTVTPPADAILVQPDAPSWSANTIKRLEPDNFRLLYLSQGDPSTLPAEFWRVAASQRRQFDRLIARNSWSSFKFLKPYWDTFFARSVLESRAALSGEQIGAFQRWSLERLPHVGNKFFLGKVRVVDKSSNSIHTGDLTERVVHHLVGLMRNHGLDDSVDQNTKDRMRDVALAEAKTRFPDSSQWSGIYIGEDLVTGIALKATPSWFEQEWQVTAQSDAVSGNVEPVLVIRVDDTHAFVSSDGKPGIVLSIVPDRLHFIEETGDTVVFTAAGQADTKMSERALDILGVSIGAPIEEALATVTTAFDGTVKVDTLRSEDLSLPNSLRVQLAAPPEGAPKSVVDLFVDNDTNSVLAIGRHLDYQGLGITPAQITNSLLARYGPADGEVVQTNSRDPSAYLGWGQTAATAAKLKNSRRLNDDCILYPWRNYSPRANDLLRTGEVTEACGQYLVAFIQESRAVFLLLDSTEVLKRRAHELAHREEAKQIESKSKADQIQF